MEENSVSSYRQILKATSIFGGVKFFSIIINIIRSKFIAILLGPNGMGIYSMLNSTILMISGMTNFGLGISSVKNVAEANSKGNIHRISVVLKVLRRLVWITGIIGTFVTIIFSSILSKIIFGNTEYKYAFIWISITLLFNQISSGQTVLLQGLRKINYLAKSSLSGSLLGLIVSVPLFYFYKVDGIVPAIILTSLALLLRSYYYSRKVKLIKVKVSPKRTYAEGKEMMLMGFMLSLSSLFVLAKDFGLRTFISNVGGIEDVGLFSAAVVIVNNYVGLIFSAMSTDFYPRLSGEIKNKTIAHNLVNQQALIALLIITPILTIFFVYITWLIILIYSSKFLSISLILMWAGLGMLFRTASWSVAYLFLAHSNSKLFLRNELLGGSITFIFHILGYYLGGLTGVGVAILIGNIYYAFQVFIIARKNYEFSLDSEFIKTLIICLMFSFSSIMVSIFLYTPWNYIIGTIIIIISGLYSIFEIDKRIKLKVLLKQKIKI